MNNTFTAIDFETAQGKRWSICAVGLVCVADGIITHTLHQLVRPPDNYYFYKNIEIHGIKPADTLAAPTFAQVWQTIAPYIQNQTVVAHNGEFDFNCLAQTLAYYQLPLPTYHQQCTYNIYARDLATLCQIHNIPLNHHNALSDALACAELYQMFLGRK